MLKEIVIFGAGLVAGALGASYAIGWMEEEQMRETDTRTADSDEKNTEVQTA